MKRKLLILFFCLASIGLYSQVDSTKKVTEKEVFTVIEKMPEYPGGQEALNKFLAENLKYPSLAKENGIKGRVFINFTVTKEGKVTNVKVLRGIGSGCDEEAIRVVEAMPDWKPGKQRGKPVDVSYNLPISFDYEKPYVSESDNSTTKNKKGKK